MRVLVLSNLYPPNALGGYELSCRDVVDRWRDRGWQVTVLTTATSVSGVVEPAQVQPHVRRELGWYWSEHRFVRPSVGARLALERANLRALRRAVRECRPDVVSVWHLGGMSLSLLSEAHRLGLPVVLNICDDWPTYAPRADAWLDGWSSKPLLARRIGAALSGVATMAPDLDACRASVVSSWTLEQVRARSPWHFTDATVVGSGVDTADFPAAAATDRPWSGRLLGVGRIEPRKGFDTAVRALALLPGATLRLLGVADPDHLAELTALADGLGVRDRLTVGAVPRAELRDVYAHTDVLLFPSRWDEPFGLVPLEAMTQAVPVVATRRGGSAEFLVDGGNCLEVPADDPAAAAVAVLRLGDDPALRRQLAQGGLSTAARHTVDRLAADLAALHTGRPVGATPLAEAASLSWGRAARVCVVVSTHGRRDLLAGLLDRLDTQDHDAFEVVLCDNGSCDGTWELLTGWVARTPVAALVLRLAFHDGPAVPRNTAVLRAHARLVAFTDDDCLPAASWLRALTEPMTDPAVAVVQGLTRPEAGGWAGPWGRSLTVTAVTGLSETANLACRRSDVVEAGGFPARRLLSGRAFGEDVLLGAALARRGQVRHAPAALVEHRVLRGSYRDHLRERHRLGGFPLLAAAVPELAPGRVFLSRRTAAVDAGVAGLAMALLGRRAWPLAAALPWASACWRAAPQRPGRPRVVRAAQLAVGDVVALAGLVQGSARARRLLL